MNTKVNNWAIVLPLGVETSNLSIIKGIKNTLADIMSRLIEITPEIEQEQN